MWMNDLQLRIRAATQDDAAAIAAIYHPYVQDTAVSFEIEPPSADVMAGRIAGTIATHPWLVAENGERDIMAMPIAADTETVQPIAGPLTRRSTLTKRTAERESD
jgi:L-amino acid N-acyltransferase YncA